jgi:hypothetical protein
MELALGEYRKLCAGNDFGFETKDNYIYATDSDKPLQQEMAALEKLGIPVVEVYRQAVKEVGGNTEIVCAQDKAVQSLCEGWSRNGIGWVTDTMPSKIEGCTNVILYYGSSSYNVAQMSRLINIIVEDCRQVGIETKSEEEVASLLQQWR